MGCMESTPWHLNQVRTSCLASVDFNLEENRFVVEVVVTYIQLKWSPNYISRFKKYVIGLEKRLEW